MITGATGFIGSHLTRRLVKQGWTVHLVLRHSSSVDSLEEVVEQVHIHRHDGTTENLYDIVQVAQPDVVFHLASLFLVQHKISEVEPLIKSNITFGAQLAEAMVQNGVAFLINAGTYWQHYQNEDYNPACLYAATKQAFEAVLKFYVEASSLKVITLVLFDTYGPNDPRRKLFTLLKATAETQEPLIMSPGEQLLDLVYISDVVEAFLVAANRLLAGKVIKSEEYMVSSGNPVSLRQVVKLFEEATGQKLPVRWGERPYWKRQIMVPWNRAAGLPCWSPKVGLLDGIRHIWFGVRHE